MSLTQHCKLQPISLVSLLSLVSIMTLPPPYTRCATHITAEMLPLMRNLTLKSTTAIQSQHPEKFILETAVGGHLTSLRGRAAIYNYGLHSSQQPRTQLSITNPAPGTSTELVRSTGDPRITHGPLQYLPQLDLSMAAIHTDHHQNSTGDISDLDPNTQIEATTVVGAIDTLRVLKRADWDDPARGGRPAAFNPTALVDTLLYVPGTRTYI
jgi:hypothetical protein